MNDKFINCYFDVKFLMSETYLNTLPDEVLAVIITKCDKASAAYVRDAYPKITDELILAAGNVSVEIYNEFKHIEIEYNHIFNCFDLFGLIAAVRSRPEDMPQLEEEYPYLRVWSLWKKLQRHVDPGRAYPTSRITFKERYGRMYICIPDKLMKFISGEWLVGDIINMRVIDWDNLMNDIILYESTINYSFENYAPGDNTSIHQNTSNNINAYRFLYVIIALLCKKEPVLTIRSPRGIYFNYFTYVSIKR